MNIEELFNRRFGEKVKENNVKMLPQRLEYKKVKEIAYDSIALVIIGLVVSIIMRFYTYSYFICLIFLGFYLCLVILYYTERTRKCKECGERMHRFEYDNNVFFCCDNCKTKIKCIISLDNYS